MILVRYSGDIATKARHTRRQFTRRLADNLRDALRAEGLEAPVRAEWNRTYVKSDDPRAAEVASRVFGVQSVSAGEHRRGSTLEEVVAAGLEIFRPLVAGKRFAVRARRLGRSERIPFRSRDVEVALGAKLLPHAARVDLTDPEVTAHVEVSPGEVVYFPDRLSGPGGIPIGTQGRALALVSGGFDSAVAAWMMLKRGLAVDYLFLNLGGAAHEEAAIRVAKVVADRWSYGYRPKLHAVDLRPYVEAMQARIAPRYLQVVLKRVMLRVAERIARARDHTALVTGEAVGQVSSQTLKNLAVIDRATELCVLRPLVGFNKDEILDGARRIGTYDLSAGVPEFCALTPSRPATRAALDAIEAEEARLDLAPLDAAVAGAAVFDLRAFDLAAADRADLAVTSIPPGAVVLDLRPLFLYRQGHAPGALHLEYGMALKAFPSLDRTRTYVLYCELGYTRAFVGGVLREAGFDAYHVRAGLRGLGGGTGAPAARAPEGTGREAGGEAGV